MKRRIQHGRKEEAQRGARRAQAVCEILNDLAPDFSQTAVSPKYAGSFAYDNYATLKDAAFSYGRNSQEVR
jgi:hypothetical protein